jgi:NADH:ubiquinone oxidoreductase subunit 3 (subunit A)
MNTFLLTPPIAFGIAFLVVLGLLAALSHLTFRGKRRTGGVTEPYACGEDMSTQMVQPNYGQFMHFAFFFTILHVVALTIATVPVEVRGTLLFAVLYILGAIVGLSVLYRR